MWQELIVGAFVLLALMFWAKKLFVKNKNSPKGCGGCTGCAPSNKHCSS